MDKHIVVYDPKGEYWEGGLLEIERANQLAARGVVTLPIATELMRLSGVGGFHKRCWGGGYPIDSQIPVVHCPLTLFCTPDFQALHWVARLQCNPAYVGRVREGDRLLGQLRLTQDTGQSTPFHVGLSANSKPVDAGELDAIDEDDGWIVRGRALLQAPQDGHYGFGLYGAMAGVQVAWAAVSLASA
jgi:hypothetical protein